MPFTRPEIFDELARQRQDGTVEWIDSDMIGCHPLINVSGEEEPGFNVLFSRLEDGDPEFDHLLLWFRMTNPPPAALSWCQAEAPFRQFLSMFLHEEALHLRLGLLVASHSLDRSTFTHNYWTFSSALAQLFRDLGNPRQR